jgi:hypothetical protein
MSARCRADGPHSELVFENGNARLDDSLHYRCADHWPDNLCSRLIVSARRAQRCGRPVKANGLCGACAYYAPRVAATEQRRSDAQEFLSANGFPGRLNKTGSGVYVNVDDLMAWLSARGGDA